MGHLLCLFLCAWVLVKSGIRLVECHAFTLFNGLLWLGLLAFMLLITADWVKTTNRSAE